MQTTEASLDPEDDLMTEQPHAFRLMRAILLKGAADLAENLHGQPTFYSQIEEALFRPQNRVVRN
jgi:hypothetical protein